MTWVEAVKLVALFMGEVFTCVIILFVSALIGIRSETPVRTMWMWTWILFGIHFIVLGVIAFIGHVLWLAVISAGMAGLCFYHAYEEWKKKPPRRKEPRLLGVVRDLGGKLGIVPT